MMHLRSGTRWVVRRRRAGRLGVERKRAGGDEDTWQKPEQTLFAGIHDVLLVTDAI